MSKVNNTSISVALCTYNGLPFLRDQLLSIARQVVRPCELIVADDSSTDNTISLVKSFAEKALFPVRIIENQVNLGVVGNYSNVISFCAGDYVALCDQDDIWLPEKLEISMQRIQSAESLYGAKTPLLLHTDLKVIDISGKAVAPSFINMRKLRPIQSDPLRILLAQNFVTGCTVMMNRSLIDAALPIPESSVMHDWWLALVAAAKGKIIYEPSQLVLYRRHERNVVGPKGYYSRSNISRIGKLKTLEKELAGTIDQALALEKRLLNESESGNLEWIADLLDNISKGGIRAVKAVCHHNVRKQGLARNALYKILLLKGGYVNYLKQQLKGYG